MDHFRGLLANTGIGYTQNMIGKWLPKILLLALLISAQALYVSHFDQHLNDSSTNCSICLQASAGGHAIGINSLVIVKSSLSCEQFLPVKEQACQAETQRHHQSRAPPIS